jgi:hypothetical protein
MMPSMPGSGTAVPPVDDEVVLPPDVLPPDVLPPDLLPPELDDVEAPPHELDVVEEVDELDDDELEPCLPPAPPLEPDQPPDEEPPQPPPHDPPDVGICASAGVAINRPARTLASAAVCFIGRFPSRADLARALLMSG